jgi:hypothetical protein
MFLERGRRVKVSQPPGIRIGSCPLTCAPRPKARRVPRGVPLVLGSVILLAGSARASVAPDASELSERGRDAASSSSAVLILWEAPDVGGAELAPPWRRALAQALREVARSPGVIICFDEAPTSADAVLAQACSDRALSSGWFLWTGELAVTTNDAVASVRLILHLEARPARHRRRGPDPKTVILQDSVFVPDGEGGPELDDFLAPKLASFIRTTPAIEGWFRDLRDHPRLTLVELPGPPVDLPGSAEEVAQAPVPAGEETAAWNRAEGRIVDLLLAGLFADARDAAERLLREPLPPGRASRVEALRQRAEERLQAEHDAPAPAQNAVEAFHLGDAPAVAQGAGDSSGGPEPSATTGDAAAGAPPSEAAPPETSTAESPQGESPTSGEPPAPPAPFRASFTVRVAEEGKGFAVGTDGRLTIDEAGIRFVPDGRGEGRWSMPWSTLAAARRAEGLWDVRSPLEIESKDGRRHFLVELDGSQSFGPGSRILAAIAEGRRRR